jgi:tetratricopeptide (TPR) repeat protein
MIEDASPEVRGGNGMVMRQGGSGCFVFCSRGFQVALLVLSSCFSLSAQQSESPAMAEIVNQLRQGDNQQALSLADHALSSQPRDCKLLSLKGVALTGLSQSDAALHSFENALTKCPAYLPALEGAAQIAYAQSNPNAPALLTRILVVQPDNVPAHAMLASILRTQGKCAEAMSHFEASRPLFPSRPQLQQGYGYCLAQSANFKAALVEYSELLASNPNDNIRYDVAVLQWKIHAADDALATLAPLVAGGQNASALTLASRIHEEKSETPQAVDLLRSAILLTPDNVDNYLDFADLAFSHKSFDVGIDMLNAGLKRLPDSAPLYLARGILEVQVSKFDVAVADFERAHQLDPKLSFAEDAMGMMQSQQHKDAASRAFFQAQAKQHPDDPFLLYLLAEQLSQGTEEAGGENLTAAIAAAKRSVLLDTHFQAARDLLAVLYLRAKQPVLAIQQAELALAEDPNDQAALYQEIMAKRRSGDTSQIQALTERFNAIRKENLRKEQSADRYRLQDEVSH